MTGPGPEMVTVPDSRAAADAAAQRIAAAGREAVKERGSFSLAVSGGRTPWLMLAILSTSDMPWEETRLFQVDERIASPGSPDRNLTNLILTLPIEKQAALRPMPVTRRNLAEAAAEYDGELPEQLDLVHLGLGPDGHTASLVPGDPVLNVTDRRVAITEQPYQGYRRMTLTFPAIEQARSVLWLVTGDSKQEALGRMLAGDPDIPAGRVKNENSVVIADISAVDGTHPSSPLDDSQAT